MSAIMITHEGHVACHATQLLRQGFTIIRGATTPESLAAIDEDLSPTFASAPFETQAASGGTNKRLGRLLARSRHVETLVMNRMVIDIVEAILKPHCDTVQLNSTQALAVYPGAPEQSAQRAQDSWPVGLGKRECCVNVLWPLTPFARGKTGVRLWPGSHGAKALARQTADEPDVPVLAPGSAMLLLGSTLHGLGANRSDEECRGVLVSYALGWLKPFENQWLAYPPDIARHFDPELAALVGYARHGPDLSNFEGQCPSILLGDFKPERFDAIDACRGDQNATATRQPASGSDET